MPKLDVDKLADIRSALFDFDATCADIGGCGNHGCAVVAPKGQGTNGGCKCIRNDPFKGQRIAQAARRLRNAIEFNTAN